MRVIFGVKKIFRFYIPLLWKELVYQKRGQNVNKTIPEENSYSGEREREEIYENRDKRKLSNSL